ncbi:hypothetical protein [Arthrobacter sp. ISL-30]|jgi:hypothetical protein|uniref:hypothetical protein n=1 Tax=Arthrobacter sp. ISL-30 TaxID=2819109 RepID=UPI001BEA37A3|nr:hypothetical protein [Arthrobacter sp. ISL-30]MBT2515279.1 hypothetical protein [Arthrobacter sp. ISL-30]
MDATDSPKKRPGRSTIEGDPAYDYAEDQAVEQDWDEEDDVLDTEERVVPIDDEVNRAADESRES